MKRLALLLSLTRCAAHGHTRAGRRRPRAAVPPERDSRLLPRPGDLVPGLRPREAVAGNEVAPIWVVTNGVDAQRNVVDTVPGRSDYTPLWAVRMVTWKDGVAPRVLRSRSAVDAAGVRGEVTVKAFRRSSTALSSDTAAEGARVRRAHASRTLEPWTSRSPEAVAVAPSASRSSSRSCQPGTATARAASGAPGRPRRRTRAPSRARCGSCRARRSCEAGRPKAVARRCSAYGADRRCSAASRARASTRVSGSARSTAIRASVRRRGPSSRTRPAGRRSRTTAFRGIRSRRRDRQRDAGCPTRACHAASIASPGRETKPARTTTSPSRVSASTTSVSRLSTGSGRIATRRRTAALR